AICSCITVTEIHMTCFFQISMRRVIRMEQKSNAIVHFWNDHTSGKGNVIPGTSAIAHGSQYRFAAGWKSLQSLQDTASHPLWFCVEPPIQVHHRKSGMHFCLCCFHMKQQGTA